MDSSEYSSRLVQEVPRAKWANKTEFILSCMGYAIGIGNVWRFPYLCYKSGGGAFLIPYITLLPLAAIPLFFMETCLGQFPSTGVITMYKMCPLLKGGAYTMIVINLISNVYYNVLLSYPILFFCRSMASELPWVHCNNSWNTPACLELSAHKYIHNSTLNDSRRSLPPMYDRNGIAYDRAKTPADEYFHNEILRISSGIEEQGTFVWPIVISDIVSWVIIFLCTVKGVKSIGKVVYVTVSLPYIVLFALFARAVTLPGSWTGMKYYLIPDFKKLMEIKVWSAAALQVFFSLGPGWGGIVNMASFNNFKNNTQMDSLFLPMANVATSIFAGAVVFAVLGFMSHETGLPVGIVATEGAGLAFVTYPEAIALMPFPVLWALLFFVMFYSLGIDSIFVQIEAVITTVTDESQLLRKNHLWVTVIFITILFFFTLPLCTNGGIYILVLVDYYALAIPVMILCFCELVMVVHIYKVKNFVRDIEFMIGKKLCRGWVFLWKYATFFVMIFVIYSSIAYHSNPTYNNVEFPWQAHMVGWLMIAASVSLIPFYMIYLMCRKGDRTVRECIRDNLKPTKDYGPADPEDYRAWREMIREQQVLGEIDASQVRKRAANVPSKSAMPKSHTNDGRSSSVLETRDPNLIGINSKTLKPLQLPTSPKSFTGLRSVSKTNSKLVANLNSMKDEKAFSGVVPRESGILGKRTLGSSKSSKGILSPSVSTEQRKEEPKQSTSKAKKK